MKKKLYRNTDDKLVAGVLSGCADYFGGDATVWRILFVIGLILTGFAPLIFIYLFAWILIPVRPSVEPVEKDAYVVHD